MKNTARNKRITRHKRVRARIRGTAERPRLSVARSNRHIALQLIDDVARKTIAYASDTEEVIKAKGKKPVEIAHMIGVLLAEKAKAKKITTAIFDRGGYKYHGRVKAAAEGARSGGLEF
ncbi:MAG: 50S ribosomal protein L18 [Candidatus Ryanbacteria bacterium RIFCSPHIGHO2_02_FULL_48_12]|jgi:large subunit ribosomal protein L18|uniref:Large ribosomal subunit protein uL18 n=1 Tax=Candidatus Ryanbacteria bacterium RIFCSPHIGHO2_01_FULL_48_27 TaxID=1802115 RepID=A0A1G2G420_9BACT|nr:MAG: 50S ribosomal protein L18 [Candidatus Ryanbacteria bacterium RIFCSPHIGHO2_01_FULL_48_27]OGZ50760.1 MAG: 50S ribosomal protein L18 [Candidatus Ryanbacteria bacterium RIFCSPHIGHO2_02_FULL_48_12]